MNENKNDDCDHKWDSDTPVRLCLRCGQIRTFPNGDPNPRVLWPGRETKDDPLQLPKADKVLIAGVAQRDGAKKAAEVTGITMITLRAWIGAYCRKPTEPRGVHTGESLPTPQRQVRKRGRPRKGPLPQVVGRGGEANDGLMPPALAVVLTEFDPGDCFICSREISLPSSAEDSNPCYIQSPGGNIWLCAVCAEKVPKLFKALGIPCQVSAITKEELLSHAAGGKDLA